MNNVLAHAAATPPDHSTREIPLTQGKVALVDAADFEWLSQWKWHAHRGHKVWYARRDKVEKRKQNRIYMHRQILGLSSEWQVDHKNLNGLDNRRANLRPATHQQNLCNHGPISTNTSGSKGVRWNKRLRKWTASISIHNRSKHLGCFANLEGAVAAYEKAARELHGDFARTQA